MFTERKTRGSSTLEAIAAACAHLGKQRAGAADESPGRSPLLHYEM